MKLITILLAGLIVAQTAIWQTDFEKAKVQAATEHKLILLNFSGSDWCLPCMRLHKEIFGSSNFENFASDNLVLVNADFPRLKKNKLAKPLEQQNEALADRYNKEGKFPFTILLTADGKVLKQWDGYPGGSTETFLDEIKQYTYAGR